MITTRIVNAKKLFQLNRIEPECLSDNSIKQ